MTSSDTNDERWLSEAEAADFFSRAAQLDAGQAVRFRHVREAAVEAGLSVDAVDDAAAEMLEASMDGTLPDWVHPRISSLPACCSSAVPPFRPRRFDGWTSTPHGTD